MSGRGPPARPPLAQRRLPWDRAEFASLDFEATGLDFRRDTIISFGVVPIREGRVEVGEAVYELVDPGEVPQLPRSITIHMLRPVDLAGAQSLEEAAEKLRAAIERRFLVTWWAGVEAGFLDKIFGGGARRWLKRCVDVRKLAMALEGGRGLAAGESTLAEVAERYRVPVASPHHALDDALVTAQLFLVLASRLGRQGPRTVKDLIDESLREPPVLRRPRAPI